MRLDIRAFAVAGAVMWGAAVLLGTWWIIILDGPQDGVPFLASIYRGYAITPVGSFIGLLWAVVDGLMGGAIFAWIYNKAVAHI